MNKILIFITFLHMTTTGYTQEIDIEQVKEQQNYFAGKISIPENYKFSCARKITVDGVPAVLFRYTKSKDDMLNGEHFSFITTEKTPFKILGFTLMDKKYADKEQLSKKETEKVANLFLESIDAGLKKKLSNLWIEVHDEEVHINNSIIIVQGMKYKCYNKLEDNYAWVIVGFDGNIITFERDILWSNGMQKRVTEKWLHDQWLRTYKSKR